MIGSNYIGSHVVPGKRWAPFIEKSGENHGMVSIEELITDPYLPTVALDPYDMARSIVIPSGRFVSVGYNKPGGAERFPWNGSGKTPLTLHEGNKLTPIGFSVNNMYREATDGMVGSNTVKFRRGFVAELPYVQSINDAHGALTPGSKLTGYHGSTTSTSLPSFVHRGKPCAWVARRTYLATSAASALITLDAAIYPGIKPSLVYVKNASAIVSATDGANVVWNAALSKWQYSGSAATEVMYLWGQTEDQIGGEVVRIQSLSDILDRSDFLKWVEYSQNDRATFPPLAPASQRREAALVSDEALTFDGAGSARVANFPMSIHHEAVLEIKGTVVDKDGFTNTYEDWFTLPNGRDDVRGGYNGLYHTINWRTGVIQLAANVTVTAARITYSYIVGEPRSHVLWGGGIVNLTDGRHVNTLGSRSPAGLPTHLDLPDVVAAMRIIVK